MAGRADDRPGVAGRGRRVAGGWPGGWIGGRDAQQKGAGITGPSRMIGIQGIYPIIPKARPHCITPRCSVTGKVDSTRLTSAFSATRADFSASLRSSRLA